MRWLLSGAFLVLSVVAWVFVNPARGFGVCFPGLTTYDMVPFPFVDFQARAGGQVRRLSSGPGLTFDQAAWLVEDKPETLIISTGWKGRMQVDRRIVDFLHGYDVRVMKTDEAVLLYNRLRDEQGRRVAIHVRSTD